MTAELCGIVLANAEETHLTCEEILENLNGQNIMERRKEEKVRIPVMEKSFTMLKPETVERNLIGAILKKIEDSGFRILAIKLIRATQQQAEKLYEPHVDKSFYNELVQHITSSPILPLIVEREDAINKLRTLIGATNPDKAEIGTIRKDFGISITKNVIHAADSKENFERESKIFFSQDDIVY